MPFNIIYLSHGGKKYYDQTRFSVLSLLHLLIEQQRQDIHIVVYTDSLESVPQHPLIQAIAIEKSQLAAYRGRFDYVHRIKLEVLQRASLEVGTPLLYVDCDSRWRSLPDELFARLQINLPNQQQVGCMHVLEGQFCPEFFPEYQQAVEMFGPQLRALGVRDTSHLAMWNAGAIGVPAGADHFFTQALAINDFLLPRVNARNWIEQFALSLVACSRFRMEALDQALHHYWNYSYEAPIYLNEIFAAMAPDWDVTRQAKYCAQLSWDESRLKQIQSAPEHKALRRSNKRRNSLYKRKIDLRIALVRLGLRLTRQF